MTTQPPPRPRTSPENQPTTPRLADLSHDWVVAASIPVDKNQAKLATMRRFHVVKEKVKVKADDVYCHGCKRTMGAAADTECAAKKKDNEHLIGGDQRERAKRKALVVPPNATRVAGPSIDRRGVRGVVLGEA